jgi:hypothetical protein
MRYTPIAIVLGLIIFPSAVAASYFLFADNEGGMAIGVVIWN